MDDGRSDRAPGGSPTDRGGGHPGQGPGHRGDGRGDGRRHRRRQENSWADGAPTPTDDSVTSGSSHSTPLREGHAGHLHDQKAPGDEQRASPAKQAAEAMIRHRRRFLDHQCTTTTSRRRLRSAELTAPTVGRLTRCHGHGRRPDLPNAEGCFVSQCRRQVADHRVVSRPITAQPRHRPPGAPSTVKRSSGRSTRERPSGASGSAPGAVRDRGDRDAEQGGQDQRRQVGLRAEASPRGPGAASRAVASVMGHHELAGPRRHTHSG